MVRAVNSEPVSHTRGIPQKQVFSTGELENAKTIPVAATMNRFVFSEIEKEEIRQDTRQI
jgi:hypothetical protein